MKFTLKSYESRSVRELERKARYPVYAGCESGTTKKLSLFLKNWSR
jgi:hypothetical protein